MLDINLKDDFKEPYNITLDKHYDEEVVFEDMKFHHIKDGTYGVESPITVTKIKLDKILEDNPTVALLGVYTKDSLDKHGYPKKKGARFVIFGACSQIYSDSYEKDLHSRWCNVDKDLFEIPNDLRFLGDRDLFTSQTNYQRYGDLDLDTDYPFAFKFSKDVKRVNGYREYMLFIKEGVFAFLVEDGIYKLESTVQVDINTGFIYDGKRVAAIAHSIDFHPTPFVGLDFIAVGEENFKRLKEISNCVKDSWYFEFREESMSVEPINLCELDNSTDLEKIRDESARKEKEYELTISGSEIVRGVGIKNIMLELKTYFLGDLSLDTYNYAFIRDNLLVVNNSTDKSKEQSFNLEFAYYLVVIETRKLENGIEYPLIHKVIDCKEEKINEILTKSLPANLVDTF